MTETAWLYAVVSSSLQADTLADQESWARRACAANGWSLERVFSATATGKRGVRKLLVQLVAELKAVPRAERPTRVLMLRLDRIGRGSIVESQVALREIHQLGSIVHTRDGGDQRLDGAMDELIAAAKFAVASFENDVRREKSLAFHARKRAAGEWATAAAYGFVLVDKRLAPYEPEAAIVRELFERRLAGLGYQRLAMHVADIAPGKMRPNGERRTIRWSSSTVASLLKNRVYRGRIVSDAVWDAAASMRGRVVDRPAPRWPWPLRGAIRCTCGAQLFGEASGRESRRTRYYVCRQIQRHRNPRYPHHNAQRLEAQFFMLLEQLEASPELAAAHAPRPADTERLAQRSAALARERSALERRRSRAWELAEDGSIAAADLAARLDEIGRESDRIAAAAVQAERELGDAQSRAHAASKAADVLRGAPLLWSLMPTDGRRRVARAVAAYIGGLWADPKRPGVLLRAGALPDDATRESFETVSPDASSLELGAALAEARTIVAASRAAAVPEPS